MTPDFRIACKELIPTGIDIIADILEYFFAPVRSFLKDKVIWWFESELPTKITSVIAVFLVLVGWFAYEAGQSFSWWDFTEWGVANNEDNIALNARNMIWTFGLLFGSLFALVGFANSLHRTQQKDMDLRHRERELEAVRRKADAEIFTQAVEQLGHEKVAVRLGGLYSLEQLARAAEARVDMDRDFLLNILETLASYVRDQSKEDSGSEKVATDVEAAVRILARNFSFDKSLRPAYENGGVDLRHAHLPNLEMPEGSDLRGFDFSNAKLFKAKIRKSNLTKVKFFKSYMVSSNLEESSLVDCDFQDAKLMSASMPKCDIKNSNFYSADLSSVCLGYHDSTIKNWTKRTFLYTKWNVDNPPYVFALQLDNPQLEQTIRERTEAIKKNENEDGIPF